MLIVKVCSDSVCRKMALEQAGYIVLFPKKIRNLQLVFVHNLTLAFQWCLFPSVCLGVDNFLKVKLYIHVCCLILLYLNHVQLVYILKFFLKIVNDFCHFERLKNRF
jgi:hypothetical protein